MISRRPRAVISLAIESRDYVCDPLLKRVRRWRPISCKQQVRTAGRGRERPHSCAATGSQEGSAINLAPPDSKTMISRQPKERGVQCAFFESRVKCPIRVKLRRTHGGLQRQALAGPDDGHGG